MEKLLDKAKKLFTVIEEDDSDVESEHGNNLSETEKVEIKYRGVNSFNQVKEITECLRKEYPVVMNLQSASEDVIIRVTDYLSGVLDAIDGDIVAIGINMWVCTPKNVVVEGKYVELIKQEVEDTGQRKTFSNRAVSENTIPFTPVSPYAKK